MKTTIVSTISAIALAAALVVPAQAQDASATTGGGIDRDALSSEQVQMVQEHCEALLAEEGAATMGDATTTGDATAAGDAAQAEPSASGDLAQDPMTESEMADGEGTSADAGSGEMAGDAGADASTDAGAAAGGGEATTSEGATSADAEVSGNAATPAGGGAAEGAESEIDLNTITAEDCIEAGIPG